MFDVFILIGCASLVGFQIYGTYKEVKTGQCIGWLLPASPTWSRDQKPRMFRLRQVANVLTIALLLIFTVGILMSFYHA
ncbi:MAG: hypothetical protein V4475_16410 [Pseudomonadota bacterium]